MRDPLTELGHEMTAFNAVEIEEGVNSKPQLIVDLRLQDRPEEIFGW
jgi:hypothetical protein